MIMRIVITEHMLYWIQNFPEIEKIKDVLLVVCLDGKKVTDKYNCFVSPYRHMVLGSSSGISSMRYKALKSVAEKLNDRLYWDDSILFLTDYSAESLYPFHVVKDLNEFNKLHLCTMRPFRFESKRRKNVHNELLSDLSKLTSILYFNPDEYLNRVKKKNDEIITIDSICNAYWSYLPTVINNIEKIEKTSCFDFATNKYVPISDAWISAEHLNISELDAEVTVPLSAGPFSTLGVISTGYYPNDYSWTKEKVGILPARIDGKKICNYLRQLRVKFAEANSIDYHPEACSFTGLCAGTCEKCDAESAYLRDEFYRLPPEKRIIPDCELTEWEV